MTILLLSLAVIITALVWRGSSVPIKHRWRRRQARIMFGALRGRDRNQLPALIYAQLRAMDALAFEELLLDSVKRWGYRVVRNRRYTGDDGVDGQVLLDGGIALIQAKRYGSAIRSEHVRVFASLCVARTTPRLFIHTGRTNRRRRDIVAQHVHGQGRRRGATAGADHRRAACDWEKGAMRQKLRPICAAMLMLVAVPAVAQVHGAGTVAEERLIARCIHQSARGKPWLEKTLWGLRDQEGGWIGAEVKNTNDSYDLGPLQVNSWWVTRIAHLLHRSPANVREWLRHNPCFNVETGRWIFLSTLAATSEYWEAVGRYHSAIRWRKSQYVSGFLMKLKRRYGEQKLTRTSKDHFSRKVYIVKL